MPRRRRTDLTGPALVDLRGMRRWLLREAGKARMLELIERIRSAAEAYADHPIAGRTEAAFGQDVRSFVVSPYIVYYWKTDRGIEILRLLHGARDLAAAWQRAGRDTDS